MSAELTGCAAKVSTASVNQTGSQRRKSERSPCFNCAEEGVRDTSGRCCAILTLGSGVRR